MKRILCALAALFALAVLSGCASIQHAGHAAYNVTPIIDGNGKVAGCQLAVSDGKEFEGRQFQFIGSACALTVTEGESKAFKGQAIGAKALAVFPVTDLANILSGGGK
jgi:hypothetical protein